MYLLSMHINDIHIRNQNNRDFNYYLYTYYFGERSGIMSITLEQAKAMMTPEAIENLKQVVVNHPNINIERKANCDILMQALCRAVVEEVIHPESLDDRLVKLLNAKTNTLSPSKLGEIITQLRKTQSKMCCVIRVLEPVNDEVLRKWVFTGPEVRFKGMFGDVIKMFEITPSIVRNKMTETLKPTIVNNIAQCVAKYMTLEDDEDINVSITTISRLVNMCGYIIHADFEEVDI